MTKMVYITLLQTCMIAGLPRSPVEGTQQVSQEDAKRLIGAKMAEYAKIDETDDEDDGDGLSAMSVKDLRALAKTEGAEVSANADKTDFIPAIRRVRAIAQALSDLSALEDDAILKIIEDEAVEVAADADAEAMREAIIAKRFATAG